MDLKEVGHIGVAWIQLAQERNQWEVLVNMVINVWIPKITGNFLTD